MLCCKIIIIALSMHIANYGNSLCSILSYNLSHVYSAIFFCYCIMQKKRKCHFFLLLKAAQLTLADISVVGRSNGNNSNSNSRLDDYSPSEDGGCGEPHIDSTP